MPVRTDVGDINAPRACGVVQTATGAAPPRTSTPPGSAEG